MTTEKRREYDRAWRAKNRDSVLASSRRFRARKRERRLAGKRQTTRVLLTINQTIGIVPLQSGHRAIIDYADVDGVVGRTWCMIILDGRRYASARFVSPEGRDRRRLLHRVLLDDPNGVIDHKNNNGLDNRRENLRPCSQSFNLANQHKVRGKIPFKGVTRVGGDLFKAQIRLYGKTQWLGSFSRPEDAARAYDQRAIELFGSFARTNESLGLLSSTSGKELPC